MDDSKQQMHKGVDIRCNGDAVLATENGGKVVAVNHNKNTPGGKSLTVEYARADGSKVQCSYMHLSEVTVKPGDTVQAGQRLGVSGNTGTRTTGEHLHFGVANIYPDGTRRDIDPAAYLNEIAQKGHIRLQVLHNGNDLLAKYKGTETISPEKSLSPDGWMKKLLSSECGDFGMQRPDCRDGNDSIQLTDDVGRADRQQERGGTESGYIGSDGLTAHRPESVVAEHEVL